MNSQTQSILPETCQQPGVNRALWLQQHQEEEKPASEVTAQVAATLLCVLTRPCGEKHLHPVSLQSIWNLVKVRKQKLSNQPCLLSDSQVLDRVPSIVLGKVEPHWLPWPQ